MSSYYSTLPSILPSDVKMTFSSVIAVTGGQQKEGESYIMYDTIVHSDTKPPDEGGDKQYRVRCLVTNQAINNKWVDDTVIYTPGILTFNKDSRKLALHFDARSVVVMGGGKGKSPDGIGILACQFLGLVTARRVKKQTKEEDPPTQCRLEVQLERPPTCDPFPTFLFMTGRNSAITPTLRGFPPGTLGHFSAKFIRIGLPEADDTPTFEITSMHGHPPAATPPTASTEQGPPAAPSKKRKLQADSGGPTAADRPMATAQPSATQTKTKKKVAAPNAVEGKPSPKVKSREAVATTETRAEDNPNDFAATLDNTINGKSVDAEATSESHSEVGTAEIERLVSGGED